MSTLASNSNGRLGRRSLAEQIDRLDTILDGLAEALNDSVADAVRSVVGEAVRQAVQATLTEVLANPEILRTAQTIPVNPAPEPGNAARSGRVVALACDVARVTRKVVSHCWNRTLWRGRQTAGFVTSMTSMVNRTVISGWQFAYSLGELALRFRVPIGIALIVGSLAGFGAYFGGPAVAATLAALASSLVTALLVVAWPVIRLIRGT